MSSWIHNKRKLCGISQAEAAKSLGISRPTYIKMEQGTLRPSDNQKAILARIFSISHDMVEKEMKRKREEKKIISGHVIAREIPKENREKFKEVLLYILGKVGGRPNIGQTVLYKLLYFIDFDYYEKFEEQILGAVYIKNTYGPTPVSFAKIIKELEREGKIVEVKSKFFDRDQTKYLPVKEADVSGLSGRELKHIDDEIKRLGSFNARYLSELSHKDIPWFVAKDKEVIDYEHVFYRSEETSVREYEPI